MKAWSSTGFFVRMKENEGEKEKGLGLERERVVATSNVLNGEENPK